MNLPEGYHALLQQEEGFAGGFAVIAHNSHTTISLIFKDNLLVTLPVIERQDALTGGNNPKLVKLHPAGTKVYFTADNRFYDAVHPEYRIIDEDRPAAMRRGETHALAPECIRSK